MHFLLTGQKLSQVEMICWLNYGIQRLGKFYLLWIVMKVMYVDNSFVKISC